MLKLFGNISPRDRLLALLAVALVVLMVWLELKLPDSMAAMTTMVQTPGSVMADILLEGGRMLLYALGSLVVSVLVSVLAARIATDFGAALRLRLFSRVQDFSMAEIGRFSTASLITRSTNDVTQVQMLIVMGLQAMIRAPIMAGMAIGKIAGKSWQWTASTAVAVGILLVGITVLMTLVIPRFRMLQKLTDDLNRVTRENLTGLSVVRAYNAEGFEERKFDGANDALTNTGLFTGRAMAIMSPMMQLLMNGLALSVYWFGAAILQAAPLQDRLVLFSDMVVFSQYAMQVVMSFMMLVMIFIMLPRASVSARRILEVLEMPLSVSDGPGVGATDLKGEIEFQHVSFRYPDGDGDVLHDISFSAHRGETVAFIGATGCGKSTVVNLVPRFYDATEGRVLVDGVDVRQYGQEELRRKIGYVPQKALLFGGSVRSNVVYGEKEEGETPPEKRRAAIEIAQAAEFVDGLSDGEESFVAQGGANFSGGQRQRLSIARALSRDAEILIFDDSFSALDYRTDRALRNALKENCREATKLIVAQRIGTIRDADRIVVLEEGRVAGIGTHGELMTSCPVYQQIARSQLSEEELG